VSEPEESPGNKKTRINMMRVFSYEQSSSQDAGVLAASMAFFDFFGFLAVSCARR
jgi:hypothetical protein